MLFLMKKKREKRMGMYNISEEFVAKLKKLAGRECWCDDMNFSAFDYCGGNFDDAYYGGADDGESLLSKEVLKELGEGK